MPLQRHLIKRQRIELTLPKGAGKSSAATLQDEVSRIYRQQIVPMLDQLCSEWALPDQIYRMDTLELDLGTLKPQQLEAQLLAKVKASLQQALKPRIEQQNRTRVDDGDVTAATGNNAKQVMPNSNTLAAIELLELFLQTGNLPWWVDQQPVALLADNLQQLLDVNPHALIRLLQQFADNSTALTRLSSQHSDGHLAQLCVLLVPCCQSVFTQDAPTLLLAIAHSAAANNASASASRIRLLFWRNSVQIAAKSGAEYTTPAEFFQALMIRIAREMNCSHHQLLSDIQQLLHKATSDNKGYLAIESSQRLARIFSTLTTPETPQRQIKPTTAEHLQPQNVPITHDSTTAEHLQSQNAPITHDSTTAEHLQPQNAPITHDSTTAEHLQRLNAPITHDSTTAEHLQRLNAPITHDSTTAEHLQSQNAPITDESTTAIFDGQAETPLAILLRRYQSRGGFLAEVWGLLRLATVQLNTAAEANWLELLSGIASSAASSSSTQFQQLAVRALFQLLQAPASAHGLAPDRCQRLLTLLRSDSAALAKTGLQDLKTDGVTVGNAGLVILWPFLKHFFNALGLLDERDFIDLSARQRAVGLLQRLASGDDHSPEYLLPLNKLLCGLDSHHPFEFGEAISSSEMEHCDDLLTAVIAQATILNNMSCEGFRGSFLLRSGVLTQHDGHWLLRVERQTFDIVLDRLPWTWSWVKLPWMELPLRVEW